VSVNFNTTKVLITGWSGLLGYHTRAKFLAENCARKFEGKSDLFEVILSVRLNKDNRNELIEQIKDADLVLHLAGINRANDVELEEGNESLAFILIDALSTVSTPPCVVYSNSTHAGSDSAYGRGKHKVDCQFKRWAEKTQARYINLTLPHLYGEFSQPFYNTVTATFSSQLAKGENSNVSSESYVELVHAGEVADEFVRIYDEEISGNVRMLGTKMTVSELYDRLAQFKSAYDSNRFPEFENTIDVSLFNTYRYFEFPDYYPRTLQQHEDSRGVLFEAVKGGGGGQSFLSWTNPGIERGNHFHRRKVERFLVVSGKADIHIRAVFSDEIHTFPVSGEKPQFVDIPSLHTHSIVNTGSEPLLTLFWTHEIFDPDNPDTYALTVDNNQ